MGFRTKLFVAWSAVVLLLGAAIFWPVKQTIWSSFDRMANAKFKGTHSLQMEQIDRMRQIGTLVMNIPELRALIAEDNFEVSKENVESLRERLDNLAEITGVRFVAVLDRRGALIAQNSTSPWTKLDELSDYLTRSAQARPLVKQLYTGPAPQAAADELGYGLWPYHGNLYQVMGLPLVFASDDRRPARPDGALLMAAPVTDQQAATLGIGRNCQISFLVDGTMVACGLPAPLRPELLKAIAHNRWPISLPFDMTLAGRPYRSELEPIADPCSGTTVGSMLTQSDMIEAVDIQSNVSHSLLAILSGGLLAAAVVSFWLSGAITWPVRELVEGTRRVAKGDLDSVIHVRGRDEMGELARAFNDMVSQLRARQELERRVQESEAANKAKSQFLANMSHEMRTPLNGVIGMSELMLGTQLNEQQKRYATLVKTSGHLLANLINDILDFSKSEAGRLELDCADFDLHALIEEVIDLLSDRAAQKKLDLAVHIHREAPRFVRGDGPRLRQILMNLLSNAIKFSEHGSVILRVVPQSVAGDMSTLRFSVIDTGIGIAADQLERLFKPFSQVDASTTRKFGGTGLGLAISKQLAELMGGEIGVESSPNRGSTFWFTAAFARQPATAAVPPRFPAGGLRVLVADDSQVTRDILAEQLAGWDFRPTIAAGAAEALETLRTAAETAQPFHAAIIDTALSGTGGLELARIIKTDPHLRHIVVIALFSIETPVDQAALQQAGIAGHLTKPVRQSLLFDAMMRAAAASQEKTGAPPRALTSPAASPNTVPPPTTLAGRLILVAEDNEINQMVTVELLKQAGYQCDVVENGQKALETTLAGRHALILMDCQMPELDGYEATRAIREHERAIGASPIPIIALTANTIKGDRDKCLAAGMDWYCSKPVDPEQLLSAIKALLVKAPMAKPAPAAQKPDQPDDFDLHSIHWPAAPMDLPPIAMEKLAQQCMNNLAIISSVLQKFEKQMKDDIEKIEADIAGKDAAAIARTAHGLKGAAAIVAAQRLSEIAAQVEQTARDQQLGELDQQLAQLHDEARKCGDYLPRLRAMMSQALGPPSA